MKATAFNNKDKTLIIIECENKQDIRIVTAMANMPQLGAAIKDVFEGWECPFYDALKKAGFKFSSDDTYELRTALRKI
jgi:hypothetical protein